jgi:hypothetical protein
VSARAAAREGARVLGPLEGADLETWAAAQRFWDASVALRAPLLIEGGEDVAMIDLATRETRVHKAKLAARGVLDRLLCILAHEVGHHIRHPHTLLLSRRLLLFLRAEMEPLLLGAAARREGGGDALRRAGEVGRLARAGRFDFLVNLHLDVLINRDMAAEDERQPGFLEDFVALYRALVTDDPKASRGAVISFYLALYEALWFLPEGTLVSPEMAASLEAASPSWRTEAAEAVAFLEAHRGLPLRRLAGFMRAFAPYLLAGSSGDSESAARASLEGNAAPGGALSPDEAGRLLEEDGEVAEARRVIRGEGDAGEAEGRGRARASGGGPERGDGRGAAGGGFPGSATLESLEGLAPPSEAILAWYRNTSRRVAYELPASQRADDDVVVGPTELWESGDDIAEIDWRATLSQGGVAIPGVTTRRRTWLEDDPGRGETIEPWVELYIDSSGSMPDPKKSLNPQVLAAFALVRSAVEAGGRARVVQYSGPGNVKEMAAFSASAEPAYRALLEYIGGGTEFPLDVLEASVRRHRRRARVFRIVFSDADFLVNIFGTTPKAAEGQRARLATLARAAEGGDRLVAMLACAVQTDALERLRESGVEVIEVPDRRKLFEAAEALGRRLFPGAEAARA